MRDLKVIPASLAALAVIGLAGCGGGGGQTPASSAASYSPAPLTPAQMVMKAGAQAEAVKFFGGYAEGEFATTWSQLSPAVRKEVPRKVWVKVHAACRVKPSGPSRAVQAVTVFGNSAIVTSTAPGGTATTEDIFSYVSGKWRFTPKDMAIYRGKSVSADIKAAKAAGVCASWKGF
jgi:hypothetical protein